MNRKTDAKNWKFPPFDVIGETCFSPLLAAQTFQCVNETPQKRVERMSSVKVTRYYYLSFQLCLLHQLTPFLMQLTLLDRNKMGCAPSIGAQLRIKVLPTSTYSLSSPDIGLA